nr:hypothetical protein [uncultured Bacteroides sp.]
MKTKTLAWTLFVLFSTFSWISCDKDTEEPLSLHDVENNSLELYYGAKGGVTIVGGDGNYTFSTESPLIKAEMTYSNYVLFEALNIGDATVTITDKSGHSCVLNIHIGYYSENIVVAKLDATVVGDMTVDKQKELKEKALATIPVKVGGGYKFVYTDKVHSSLNAVDLNPLKGLVYIYPETYGEKPIEGTFERTAHKEGDGQNFPYYKYTLHYNNLNRTLLFLEYRGAIVRSVEYRTYQLAEDLTEQYKTDYPNVEQVYTSQVIGSIYR